MKISLEFNNIKELDEWMQYMNRKIESPESPSVEEVLSKSDDLAEKVESKEEPLVPRRGFIGMKIRKQIERAVKYSKKHKIKFSKAVKKLYGRYASNWDYEIAKRLGYPNLRKKPELQEAEDKANFIVKRTRILMETGFDHDEAKDAARKAWEAGERDANVRG